MTQRFRSLLVSSLLSFEASQGFATDCVTYSSGTACDTSYTDCPQDTNPQHCGQDCTTCGGNGTTTVEILGAQCSTSGSCPTSPCGLAETLSGWWEVQARTFCSTGGTMAICEAWVDCETQTPVCTDCQNIFFAPGARVIENWA